MAKNEKNSNSTHVKGTCNNGKDAADTRFKGRRRSKNNKGSDRSTSKTSLDNTHPYNDISWYNRNPELTADAGRVPFLTSMGTKLGISNNTPKPISSTIGVGTDIYGEYQPGLCVLEYIPGIGKSIDSSSAVNTAAANFYAYIRYANSGKTNYDAPDLMQYLLAMDSAYSFYNTIKRAIGIVNVFSAMNRYVPQAVVEALGFDYNDLKGQLPRLRTVINSFALQLNAFYVPNTMPLFERHSWMASNIYMDAPNSRAQLYAFNPLGFYIYDETMEANQLQFTPLKSEASQLLTVDDIQDYASDMIQSLIECQSFLTMGGDILKAFGPNNLVSVSYVDEQYSVLPVYNEEVLTQIENATAVGGDIYTEWTNLHISSNPSTGLIEYNPQLVKTLEAYSPINVNINPILNFHQDAVNEQMIIEASRLTMPIISAADIDASHIVYTFATLGSEIITNMRLWSFVDRLDKMSLTGEYKRKLVEYTIDSLCVYNLGEGLDVLDTFMCMIMSKFNRHPHLYYFEQLVTSGETTTIMTNFKDVITDIDNVSILSPSNLWNLNNAALFSMFGVPYRAGK